MHCTILFTWCGLQEGEILEGRAGVLSLERKSNAFCVRFSGVCCRT